MALIYFAVICVISTILSEVAYGNMMECPVFINPYGLRACTDPTGVLYFVIKNVHMDHYNVHTMQQFCRTGSASGVAQCMRNLYRDCHLPEEQSLDLIADNLERGLQSVCDGGIEDIMAARTCIASKMGAIDNCVESKYNAAHAKISEISMSMDDALRAFISPAAQCPLVEALGSCISQVVSSCDQSAARALYNLEASPNSGCSNI